MPPDVDERPLENEAPYATAVRLAESKARAVLASYPQAVVIGSDQVAVVGGTPIGKPGSHEAAFAQLRLTRKRTVVFHTALCVIDAASGRCQIETVPTTVHFRDYSEEQATRYLLAERPYDCAGSAKIEGLGIALVEWVETRDPTALIGLPLIALVTMLKRLGIEVP